MERQFNKGDFEKLLRDNANQYRMYPSERVWKGVNAALHTRRKWIGISALAFLLITGAGVSFFLINNKQGNQTKAAAIKNPPQVNSIETILPGSSSENTNTITTNSFAEEKISLPIIKPVSAAKTDIENVTIPLASNKENTYTNDEVNTVTKTETIETKTDEIRTEALNKNTETANETTNVNLSTVTTVQQEAVENIVTEKNNDQVIEENNQEKITEDKLNDILNAIASQNAIIPVKQKQAKITAQVYFTPTVSYRTLTENKKYFANGLYVNSQVVDLNKELKHKPAMGLEFGIEGKYRVNDRFSFKSGLQFNINRYDIRAYSHPTEIATVAVTSGLGTDSMSSLSNYRNKGGANANWLENFYFQAAVPFGVEIILAERKNFSWGISGTLQPTYVIGDRAYLISSDYKNYAKFPDLMRRWNLSTGIETFVVYSTGKIKWQVGPHARYQHLSSFVSGYPVKENLFAVGLKVGATINKKK